MILFVRMSDNNFLSWNKYCNDCKIIRGETTFPPGRIKRNCAINNLIRGSPTNFITCILHYSLCDLLHSLIKCIWFFSVVLLCHRRRMIHKSQKPFQSFTTISNSSHWRICHSVNIKTSNYFRFCSPETVSPLTHRNKLHSEGHALFFLFVEVSTFFPQSEHRATASKPFGSIFISSGNLSTFKSSKMIWFVPASFLSLIHFQQQYLYLQYSCQQFHKSHWIHDGCFLFW